MNLDRDFLTEDEWRRVHLYLIGDDKLYHLRVSQICGQICKQYNRWPWILMWLAKNNIRGKALVDFFKEEEGRETMGIMRGVQTALNFIDGKKLYKQKIYEDELK